jgi:hypothetical protein
VSRRRAVTIALLGSIAVNAALGIYALVASHFGTTQGKVLGTSACVTGAGILALACLPALERRRLGIVPLAGMAGSAAGFAIVVAGIWAEPDTNVFGQLAGTVFTVAGACVVASVLALATLAPAYRRLFDAALALIALLAAMILAGIWGELGSDTYPRAVGVVSVLLAATALALAILHRASRDVLAALAAAGSHEVRFCPSCGRRLAAGVSACTGCGAAFEIRWDTPEPDLRPQGRPGSVGTR